MNELSYAVNNYGTLHRPGTVAKNSLDIMHNLK